MYFFFPLSLSSILDVSALNFVGYEMWHPVKFRFSILFPTVAVAVVGGKKGEQYDKAELAVKGQISD
jgi:hypothetical protein